MFPNVESNSGNEQAATVGRSPQEARDDSERYDKRLSTNPVTGRIS